MARNDAKILIVENEVVLAQVLYELLLPDFPNIKVVYNGKQALEFLAKEHYDCVLSDIRMEEMNGVELLKEARARNHNMPFVICTADGNRDLLFEIVKYGVFDFISKPNLDHVTEIVFNASEEGKRMKRGKPADNADLEQLLQRLKEQ